MANPCRAILEREQSDASFLNAYHVVYSRWICSQMLWVLYRHCGAFFCAVACPERRGEGTLTWMQSGENEEMRTRSSMLRFETSLTTLRAWSALQESDIVGFGCGGFGWGGGGVGGGGRRWWGAAL